MIAATAKIGSKYFINVEVLQHIGSELEKLPKKEKTMFEFKDAAAFLHPFFKLAIQKNYTKEDILQIIVKAGWAITQNSFKYLWSLFLLVDESSGKKKPAPKQLPQSHVRKGKSNASENAATDFVPKHDYELETSDEEKYETETSLHEPEILNASKHDTKDSQLSGKPAANPQQPNNAHFDLPPDTDDL